MPRVTSEVLMERYGHCIRFQDAGVGSFGGRCTSCKKLFDDEEAVRAIEIESGSYGFEIWICLDYAACERRRRKEKDDAETE